MTLPLLEEAPIIEACKALRTALGLGEWQRGQDCVAIVRVSAHVRAQIADTLRDGKPREVNGVISDDGYVECFGVRFVSK